MPIIILRVTDIPRVTLAQFRYRFRSTGYSSVRYGPCTVCGEYASDVWIQLAERKKVELDEPFRNGWYYYGKQDHFGHKECLEATQEEPKIYYRKVSS